MVLSRSRFIKYFVERTNFHKVKQKSFCKLTLEAAEIKRESYYKLKGRIMASGRCKGLLSKSQGNASYVFSVFLRWKIDAQELPDLTGKSSVSQVGCCTPLVAPLLVTECTRTEPFKRSDFLVFRFYHSSVPLTRSESPLILPSSSLHTS